MSPMCWVRQQFWGWTVLVNKRPSVLVTGATQRLQPVPKPGVILRARTPLTGGLQSLCTAAASTAPAGLSYAGTARCRTTAAARQVRTAPATWPYARVAQMGTYGEGRPGRQRNGQVVIHVVSITAVVQIGAGVRLGQRRRLSRSTSPSCSVKPLHPTTSTLLTRSSHTCSTQQRSRTNRHAVGMEIHQGSSERPTRTRRRPSRRPHSRRLP